MCTPVPEAVAWEITLVSECLVHPDAPCAVLPGPVHVVVVWAQPAREVVGPTGEDSPVHHDGSLIYNQLFHLQPTTVLWILRNRNSNFFFIFWFQV